MAEEKNAINVSTKIAQGVTTKTKVLLGVVMALSVAGMFAFAGMAVKGIANPKKAEVENQIVKYEPKKIEEFKGSNMESPLADLEKIKTLKKIHKKVTNKKGNTTRNSGIIEVDQDYVDEMGGGPLVFSGDTTIIVVEDLVFSNNSTSTSGFPMGFDLYDNVVLNCQDHLIDANSTSSSTSIGIFLHNNSKVKNCNVQNFGWGFGLEDYSQVIDGIAKFNTISGFELVDFSRVENSLSESNFFGFVLNDDSTVLNSYANQNEMDGFYVGDNALVENNISNYNYRHGYVCESGTITSNIAKNNLLHGFYFDRNAKYSNCIAIANDDIGMVLGGGQPVVNTKGLLSCNNNMDFLCINSAIINGNIVLDTYGGGCSFTDAQPCLSSFNNSEIYDLELNNISCYPEHPMVNATTTIIVNGVNNSNVTLTNSAGILNFSKSFEDFQDISFIHLPDPSAEPIAPGEEFYYELIGYFTDRGFKNLNFKVDAANELIEINEDNNRAYSLVGVAQMYFGNGIYDLIDGDRIQLDNTAIIEPIYFITGSGYNQFYNVKFDVYNDDNEYLGTTDSTRVGWDPVIFNIGGYEFQVYVSEIGGNQGIWFSNITFSNPE